MNENFDSNNECKNVVFFSLFVCFVLLAPKEKKLREMNEEHGINQITFLFFLFGINKRGVLDERQEDDFWYDDW